MVSTPYVSRRGESELPTLPGYSRFGGLHGETASVANVLAYLKVRSPFTDEPFTEEMLFGLGGGLGFSYWVFDYSHLPSPMMSVGFRRFGWEGFDLAFVDDMCTRAGAHVEVRETSSRAKAARELGQVLDERRPPVITADWGKLPGSPMPDDMEYLPHVLTVCGRRRGKFLLDDLTPEPRTISPEDLAVARAAVRSVHHRVRLLSPARPPANPEEALYDAFADCAASLLEPDRPNSGLAALQKWSRMVASCGETKAWRSVFDTPERLASALAWTYRWIEIGTGGGGFRPMYARFLTEAADVLHTRQLRGLAATYRGLGKRWTALAKEVRKLSERPEEARDTLDSLAERLETLHADELVAAEEMRDLAGSRMAARA